MVGGQTQDTGEEVSKRKKDIITLLGWSSLVSLAALMLRLMGS